MRGNSSGNGETILEGMRLALGLGGVQGQASSRLSNAGKMVVLDALLAFVQAATSARHIPRDSRASHMGDINSFAHRPPVFQIADPMNNAGWEGYLISPDYVNEDEVENDRAQGGLLEDDDAAVEILTVRRSPESS